MNNFQKGAAGLATSAALLAILAVGPGLKPGRATVTPTTAPTTYPTTGPTTAPTTAPTTGATSYPTTYPTTKPTTAPGVGPTTAATTAPTTAPTTYPTTYPTTVPTTAPTTAPTTYPTTAPTSYPTTVPVVAPTTVPTTAATTAATTAPTTGPTTAPGVGATTAPTTGPTTYPTTYPTTAPTTLPTTAATSAPTTVPTTAATTAPTSYPTTAATSGPTTAPLYGFQSDSQFTAFAVSTGATHAWPMDDASGTQFGWNDTIGTDNVAFSENNTTGWAPCYPLVDGALNSTQFGSTFTGTALTNTVALLPTQNWTVAIAAVPTSYPSGSYFMNIWSTGNAVNNHDGVALYINNAGVVMLALGYNSTYNNATTAITIPTEVVASGYSSTNTQPIVISWNAATYTFNLSVGDSTIYQKNIGQAYNVGNANLSFIRNTDGSQNTLVPFIGYVNDAIYSPTIWTQAQIDSYNYGTTGPVHP